MMNLNLPSDINAFVKSLVADGRFDSEEAAIIEGVRILMGREQLKAEIQVGIDQLDNGQHFDEETVFAEVNAEIDKVESTQQGS
ncbi:type II toxin-antitoxin system ParD family antitoxin [Novipirellula sp.]|uniref:ribbon-helix-helix domain-containing protein n=1 Tax=Novipirellula sp. TaxID=2795430 RepID=UPI003563F3B8